MNRGIILSIFLLHASSALGNRISERKCQEYEGIVASSHIVDDSSGIVDPKEFPFVANIFTYYNYNERYCNGLLISEYFVLTLASDALIDYSKVSVFLGEYANRTDVAHQRFSIVQYTIGNLKIDNPALLKLNASVEFNQYVRPVCLSQPEDSITQPLLEFSWKIRKALRKELDLLPNTICNETHKWDLAGPTRICATRKVDSCYSAPVLYFECQNGCALLNGPGSDRGSNKLVALKDRSSMFSCREGFPETYVRISSYIDWIESTVWSNSLNKSAIAGVSNIFTLPTYLILLLALFQID